MPARQPLWGYASNPLVAGALTVRFEFSPTECSFGGRADEARLSRRKFSTRTRRFAEILAGSGEVFNVMSML